MRRTLLFSMMLAVVGPAASAQTTAPAQTAPGAPAVLRLTVDDAVKMAADANVDLKADRLDPADQRHARRRGGRRLQADLHDRREPQQPASAALELPHPDRHAQRHRHVERRDVAEAAVVRDVVLGRVEQHAHRQQQLPQQLQPAAADRARPERLAAARPRPLHRQLAVAARHEPREPRHRRHAAAREPRAHDRRREGGLLESGVGEGELSWREARRSSWPRSWRA